MINMIIMMDCSSDHQINQMDVEENDREGQRPEMMDQERDELGLVKKDIFDEFLAESTENHEPEVQKLERHMRHRSTKNLLRKENFRKILNSSSSNQRLIPSSINNDSSRQNSERERNVFQTENSLDEGSFRKSFKKKFEESFSIENTIRDSSSEFSERSDSKSSHNIIPAVYKQEQIMEEKKSGCNCKRSRCLKLYCQCFQKQLFCNESCNCHSCGNSPQNPNQHKQAVIEALARNAHGFEEDEDRQVNPEHKSFSLGVEPTQVRKGCKCKKTKCLKKYCECYQSGLNCGIFCRCEGCFNTEFHIMKGA